MKLLLTLSIFVLFLSSGLMMTDLFNSYHLYIMSAVYALLLFSVLLIKVKRIKVNILLLTIMTVMFVTSIISFFIHGNIGLLVHGTLLYLSFLSLSVIFNRLYTDNSLRFVFWLILGTQLPLVGTIIFNGGNTALQGIFYNPNAMGLTAATSYITLLAFLTASLEQSLLQGKKTLTAKHSFYIFICMLLFLITAGTQSRTSFMSVLAFTALTIFIIFFKGLTSRKYKATFKTIFATLSMPFVVFLIYKLTPLEDYLYEKIFIKFVARGDSNIGVLSGRDYIWKTTFEEATLFGNGSGYFTHRFGISAHNTFINYLGQHGWIYFGLFVLLILVSVYYALKFTRTSQSEFKYLPLFLIGSFVLLSMGETMTDKTAMIAMFCVIGTISVSPYKQTSINKRETKTNISSQRIAQKNVGVS